ncbi:hypothetical protein D1B31_06275 [Neobacillus notoginsengisoli]|uniref:Uncharacterized protein n=1 Tax=Neobacillus notoginsengisoli TaxID=1578198 RepID=A0A417YXL1_9BACI|nr:hypothetical protein [Neobacillus notoginsengisoli]RHW42230.1 hypothetical protein D1B31_06275 [Neobacillus notoginsengisoli]
MQLLEGIIKILDEKGPLSLYSLCDEANGLCLKEKAPLLPSEVKSILSRKNELFLVYNGIISIIPEKQPVILKAYSERPGKHAYQVKVNFSNGIFTFVEWRDKGFPAFQETPRERQPGDIRDFKAKLYHTQIWNWKRNYVKDRGIVLDGTSWSVSLQTRSGSYISSGINYFPANWTAFCMAISELTGSPFR